MQVKKKWGWLEVESFEKMSKNEQKGAKMSKNERK